MLAVPFVEGTVEDVPPPPVVLAVALSADVMDTLINALESRKILAKVVGLALTKPGTGVLDVPGITSLGSQAWGSRTMSKADEICPLGAPVWIQGGYPHAGTVLGVACTTGSPGAPEHSRLNVLLPAGSVIALRVLAQTESWPQVEVLLAAFSAHAANAGVTVTCETQPFRVGSDATAHGHGIVDIAQTTIHIHNKNLDALHKHLGPLRELHGQCSERRFVALLEPGEWGDAIELTHPIHVPPQGRHRRVVNYIRAREARVYPRGRTREGLTCIPQGTYT